MSNSRTITLHYDFRCEEISDLEDAVRKMCGLLDQFFSNERSKGAVKELSESIWKLKNKPLVTVIYYESTYFLDELQVGCHLKSCQKSEYLRLLLVIDLEDQIEATGINEVETFACDLKNACPPWIDFHENF